MQVEEAYQHIAEAGIYVFEGDSWDVIVIECEIAERMVTSSVHKLLEGKKEMPKRSSPMAIDIKVCKAALFLRDDLLKTTGDRIWGLTMSIDNQGKFNIAYSYEQPEAWKD